VRYTWDPEKNRRNKAKHRIAFEEAITVFERMTVDQIDERFDYGEERINAIGLLGTKVVMVTYVEKNDEERRIISARAATREEKRTYFIARGI
jgi:uncharacterized DUF497 family protein